MTPESLARALDAHPFLHGLAEYHLVRIAAFTREVAFAPGELILREGGTADTIYLLAEGHVTLEVQRPGRGALQVESLHGGDILGLHWFFPPRRWVLDARAVTPVRAHALDALALRARLDEDPALGYTVVQRLLKQVYERLERVRLQRLDVYGEAS